MFKKWKFIYLVALSASAVAQSVQFRGFGSVHQTFGNFGGSQVSKDRFSPHPDLKGFSKMGLNVIGQVDEKTSFASQIIAAGSAAEDNSQWSNWDLQADWLFLRHMLNENWSVRGGRQLFNAWVASEYQDVGALLIWRNAPTQVYSISPFKSFEGLSLDYATSFGAHYFKASLFGGALHNNMSHTIGENSRVRVVDGDKLIGVTAQFEGTHWMVRGQISRMNYAGSYSFGNDEVWATAGDPTDAQINNVGYEINEGITKTLGFTYTNKIIFMAEYGKTTGTGTSDFFNPQIDQTKRAGRFAEAYYATLGYELDQWTPHFTYAYGNYHTGFQEGAHKSWMWGLNKRLSNNAVFKFSYELDNAGGSGVFLSSKGKTQSTSFGVDFLF
jgi:hypothetical protein